MNKLILMYGLPGSGKSYLAKRLHEKALSENFTSVILSTDDFFTVNEEYKWSGSFISVAHKWNQGRFYKAMFDNINQIIIDNTNLQAWQCYPYVDEAIKHNYEWELLQANTKWANNPAECSKRNTHSVSEDKIQQMLDKAESFSIIKKNLMEKFGV